MVPGRKRTSRMNKEGWKVNDNGGVMSGNNSRLDPCGGRKDLGIGGTSIVGDDASCESRTFNSGCPYYSHELKMLMRFAGEVDGKVGEVWTWSPSGRGAVIRLLADCAQITGALGGGLYEESYDAEMSSPGSKASWREVVDLRAENAALQKQKEVEDFRRAKKVSSGEGPELTGLLERKILMFTKTQEELTIMKKELDRTKDRLGVAGKKNADYTLQRFV